jgi:MFS family permease
VLTSFGGGSAPAIQSLALSLAPPKDSAKILAALSVVNSIFGSALGPLVFGVLWVETLNSFAEAIFVVGFAVYAICTICLVLVGLRKLDRRPSAP